jgi:hypothetical protein
MINEYAWGIAYCFPNILVLGAHQLWKIKAEVIGPLFDTISGNILFYTVFKMDLLRYAYVVLYWDQKE